MFRIIFAFLLFIGIASAATYYVPDDYPTIQGAINACVDGDVVIVKPGTYVENIDFVGKAITVQSESGPDVTIIDGNQAGSVVMFQRGEGPATVLNGFTIKNGNGKDIHPPNGYYSGGGIYCEGSSPTITNNTITDNTATFDGGGILCWWYSFATISGNTITGNRSSYGGGGILCSRSDLTITGNTINENSALLGGGIWCWFSFATIRNNSITENTASNWGGGILCSGEDSPVIANNAIMGNLSCLGGGICCDTGTSPVIANNSIRANRAASTITDGFGGGIACWQASSPLIVNNTINGNSADYGCGICCLESSSPRVINTILWNKSTPAESEAWIGDSVNPSYLIISYSDVIGGQSSCHVEPNCTLNWGTGMIDADPLFADPTNDDFHITWSSPCKDTGDNTAITELYDFEGDPRIAGDTVDMGADEFYYHLYHIGDVVPGGSIDVKVVGPPSAPVTLALGAGVIDPPRVTPYGDLYLAFPLMQFKIGSIPSNGVLVRPSAVPLFWIPGEEKPLQALIGPLGNPNSVLTNLLTLMVE